MQGNEKAKRVLLAYGIILIIACITVIALTSSSFNIKLDTNKIQQVVKKETKKDTKNETKLSGRKLTIYKLTNKATKEVRYGKRDDFASLGSKEELKEEATFNCSTSYCNFEYANKKYALVSEKDGIYTVINVIDYKKNTLVSSRFEKR